MPSRSIQVVVLFMYSFHQWTSYIFYTAEFLMKLIKNNLSPFASMRPIISITKLYEPKIKAIFKIQGGHMTRPMNEKADNTAQMLKYSNTS